MTTLAQFHDRLLDLRDVMSRADLGEVRRRHEFRRTTLAYLNLRGTEQELDTGAMLFESASNEYVARMTLMGMQP